MREGHQVTDLIFDGDKTVGVRLTSEGSSQQEAHGEYVVDATGQAGLIGRRLGLRRWDDFFKNLAVYAYFRGAQALPSPDENNIFIESYDQGWLWSIPLHNGLTSVGAVVDSAVGQKGISGFGALEFLNDQIRRSQYTARMLQSSVMASGPSVVRDWSYDSERLVGDGFVLAGDAGCFVDPLFSSGVHLALMSGGVGRCIRHYGAERRRHSRSRRFGLRGDLPQRVRAVPGACPPLLFQQPIGGLLLLGGPTHLPVPGLQPQGVLHTHGGRAVSQGI